MLNKLLKSKNKPIAILLVESRMCDLDAFIKEYMKSIVCTGNDCVWCKKIDTDSYFDFIKIDGNKETIKKEQIQDVISRYSKSSTESRGIKFYVIYGIENSTTQAINSLLKFLEEPTNNTYAILTTRSDNFVLPTIKSRCQIYKLTKEYS
jgi:DNA polymerase-3 subunit delta'